MYEEDLNADSYFGSNFMVKNEAQMWYHYCYHTVPLKYSFSSINNAKTLLTLMPLDWWYIANRDIFIKKTNSHFRISSKNIRSKKIATGSLVNTRKHFLYQSKYS
uniref:Uncharacterized protein n=1 Tax=Anguilla anguilla TaxID=7936 RepID=A0A0E9XF45_ANGAN